MSSHEATASTPAVSPFAPRHLMSIADLEPSEVKQLVNRAREIKSITKHGNTGNAGYGALANKAIAMMFSKRSTRTRVSTEAACAHLGANSMFLGKEDIQLGVNESLYDTSRVISSMVACMVARVNGHQDVMDLAKASHVPVINALSDMFHPLQALADLMTIEEAFPDRTEKLKLAWIGDANNVLHDLMIICAKSGIDVSVATPKGITVNDEILDLARDAGDELSVIIETTHDPSVACKDADILVTDTWVSMGEEAQKAAKMAQFAGFQITSAMASQGQAKQGWKFMHCLPRHPEEVDDEVFYSTRSLVFDEAENRKWVMIAVLEHYVAANHS